MRLSSLGVPVGLTLLIAGSVTLRVMKSAEPKSIEIEPAARRLLAPTIFASGVLAYSQEVRLVPEVLARVTGIRVKEGQAVQKGELLLTLDAAAAEGAVQQLAAARAQALITIEHERVDLAAREKKLQRYARLRELAMVDASTYDDLVLQRDLGKLELRASLSSLEQTEAQLAQARVALAKTQVRAPIAGVVTSVLIKQGETAVPSAMSIAGGDLMVVAQTDQQYAEINVDETDVAEVAPGQSAKVVPAALPDASWAGEVTSVSVAPKDVNGQSKSFTVRIRLDSTPPGQFRSGMSCRAEILTRRSNAHRTLAVPVEAVHYEDPIDRGDVTRASVFVVQGGVAHVRAVETGAADDAYIEILRGLAAGEQVAARPARTLRFLREGDHVRQGAPGETEAP